MTRIDNVFVRNHFQADYVEDIGGSWATIRSGVLGARNVLADPVRFPNANVEYLENLDLEGTCFLLQSPVQYIV